MFLVGEKASRVGELDEEMVYESRVGDVFALGATSWRIEDITHDRVLVSPAPGQPGRLPFWKGDALGRPAELGAAVGGFVRELAKLDDRGGDRARHRRRPRRVRRRQPGRRSSPSSATTPATSPTTGSSLVERFRDELGDWRLIVHSPYGAAVHAPWALAIGARLRERFGIDAQAMAGDDGIVLRMPETDAEPPGAALVLFEPDEIEDLVTTEVGGSALFASRFRECAARALLLPRRDPGKRSPLWQQRQRSAALLEVASKYGSFPIVLETVRECLQDVYDVPALLQLMRDIESRRIRVVEVETQTPSPFARSLLFGYVAAFVYEGDTPLAERKAAALALDPALLAELLGRAELRDLLDPDVVDEIEAELQRLADDRQARNARGRCRPAAAARSADRATRSASDRARRRRRRRLARRPESRPARRRRSGSAGTSMVAAVEDVGSAARRPRRAGPAGRARGVHRAGRRPARRPGRPLRPHARAVHDRQTWRTGSGSGRGRPRRTAPAGGGRPGRRGRVPARRPRQRVVRRRGAAPAPPPLAGRCPQGGRAGRAGRARAASCRPGRTSAAGCAASRACCRWSSSSPGCAVPASALEPFVLASRLVDYRPAMLDELTAAGEVIWAGAGALPGTDGWVSPAPRRHRAPDAARLRRARARATARAGARRARRRRRLLLPSAHRRGRVDRRPGCGRDLWDLVWAGHLTNDTLAPLRTTLARHAAPTDRGERRHAARLGGRRSCSPARPPAGRPCRPAPAHRPSPGAGRCTPDREADPTRRAHAAAEALLERHGVVTRGAVVSERMPGGFAAVYKVLAAFEESGRCRRGYFVAGLGAAQFGTTGAVDRLRSVVARRAATSASERRAPSTLVLAATDPANPYGAALPWPERARRRRQHRPPTRPQGRRGRRARRRVTSRCTSSAAAAPC